MEVLEEDDHIVCDQLNLVKIVNFYNSFIQDRSQWTRLGNIKNCFKKKLNSLCTLLLAEFFEL